MLATHQHHVYTNMLPAASPAATLVSSSSVVVAAGGAMVLAGDEAAEAGGEHASLSTVVLGSAAGLLLGFLGDSAVPSDMPLLVITCGAQVRGASEHRTVCGGRRVRLKKPSVPVWLLCTVLHMHGASI